MSGMGRPAKKIGELGNTTVTDNPNGTFTARVSVRGDDGKNRVVERTARKKSDAESSVKAAAQEQVRRGARQGVTAATTIAQLVDIYVDGVRRNKKMAVQTKTRYEHTANNTIRNQWPSLRVSELDAGTTAIFLESLAEEHLSEARVTRTVLRAVLHIAVRANAVGSNAVVAAAAQLAMPRKDPRAMTIEELELLREMIRAWRTGPEVSGPKPTTNLLDLVSIMLATGARISEVLALRRENVHIEGDDVLLDIGATIVFGEGVGSHVQEHTKTGASAEGVLLTSTAAQAVRTRALDGGHKYLFATKNGKPIQQQNLGRQLRSIVKGTELEWVTSHVFRKTSGTCVYRAKGLTAASVHLRHRDERITASTYVEKEKQSADHRSVLEQLSGN